jgi:NADH dehydrogenase
VFVTGGGGFVGRRLVGELAAAGHRVVALDRSGRLASLAASGIEIVKADLLDPASYRAALAGCDMVLHLAAATGRAPAAEHHRINARGTETLVSETRMAGVANFLFVSSIAVSFPDLRGYHYAQSKQLAEEIVRGSGLRFLIVRPTMILGAGSPILTSLEKLACLPVAVVPGSGSARVQPIHVDDVVASLVAAASMESLGNDVIALGGRETVSIETLLRRIRSARRGTTGPVVRLPLAVFQVPLRMAEAMGLSGLLPITAGQLTSFRFDGVGDRNTLLPEGAAMQGLEEMLGEPTGTASEGDLDTECDVFTTYLAGRTANDYVRAKYRGAHAVSAALADSGAFDRFLVRFARAGSLFTRLADAYAALFTPASLLRRKLVLLLAILETCPPYFQQFDAPLGGTAVGAVLRLFATGLGAGLSLIVGSLLLLPVRIFFALAGGRR